MVKELGVVKKVDEEQEKGVGKLMLSDEIEHIMQKKLPHIDYGSVEKLKVSGKSGPYQSGEYHIPIKKPSYQPRAGLTAEQVKHAIPYAKVGRKADQMLTKRGMKLAKPLAKKIVKETAIKASSLPITRQCPECGSFKVKTYKNNVNKCLECKHRF